MKIDLTKKLAAQNKELVVLKHAINQLDRKIARVTQIAERVQGQNRMLTETVTALKNRMRNE